MFKIEFIEPDTTETPASICWHNLLVSDKIHNLEYFIYASYAWLKLNLGKNYQDLEKTLRDNNFNTHLYALQKPNEKAQLCKLSADGTTTMVDDALEYRCISSCRPKDLALQEVLSYWPTYEENVKALAKAGDLIYDKNNTEISLDIAYKENPIINNQKKLKVIKYTPKQMIDAIITDCTKVHGQSPTACIVGLNKNGGPIMGFFIDNKLVSEYGYSIICNPDMSQSYSIVKLS